MNSSKCFYGIRKERSVNVKLDMVFCEPQVLPNTRPSCTPPLYKQYLLPVADFLPDSRRDSLYSFKYNQQDATLYNIIYYCQCYTCFRRFLRPSSGAQNCTHIWYMSSLLAATASVGELFQLIHASGSSKQALTYTRCVYSFELLMMGGETA
jgi:hypothetical protein